MLQVDTIFKFIVMIECCIQFYSVEENAKDLI